jgi:hypothetical protein
LIEPTNDDIFDGKVREEEKRSQHPGIPIRFSFHHHIFSFLLAFIIIMMTIYVVSFIKDKSIFFGCQDHGSLQT